MTPPKDLQTIAAQLCEFVRANLVAPGTAFDEQSLFAESGIDSYALVEVLLYCERALGVRVPETHLTRKHLASVAALACCIAELTQTPPAPPAVAAAAPYA